MISVFESTQKIIESSPFLEDALEKGIINYSGLARIIVPDLEKKLLKQVSTSSVVSALRRLRLHINKNRKVKSLFKTKPEMTVRSNLFEITVSNNYRHNKNFSKIFDIYSNDKKRFFILVEGLEEISFIASMQLYNQIKELTKDETLIIDRKETAAVTILLKPELVDIPGIGYSFLKSLAWEGINIFCSILTYLEFTVLVDNKDVDKAFSVLKNLYY